MNAVGFALLQLAALAGLAAAALLGGTAVARVVSPAPPSATPPAIRIAAGLVALATIGALLGLAGRLEPLPLALATALLAGAGAVVTIRSGRRPGDSRPATPALFALALVPCAILSLSPPFAFDETLYHLPMARAFAASGALPFLPELRFPVFPQLAEVLFAELLLVAGDVATHLVSLLATAATALLVWTWAGELGNGRRTTRALAVAAWLGSPLVVFVGAAAYVEPLLALFAAASVYSVHRFLREPETRWAVYASLFAAAAASTKYLGLYFLLAPTIVVARSTPRTRIRNFALLAAVAIVVAAPWYGRIVAMTGNPVFPYLSGWFGPNEWKPMNFEHLAGVSPAAEWLGRLATLAWDVAFRRERVGSQPPLLLPLHVIALVLAFLGSRTPARRAASRKTAEPDLARWIPAGFAVPYLGLVLLLPGEVRYLYPAIPLLAVVAAEVGSSVLGLLPAAIRPTAAALLVVGSAAPAWLYAGYRLDRTGLPPLTPPAREAWLRRNLPYYPAVAWLNEHRRPGERVYGLRLEQARDAVRDGFVGDYFGPRRFGLILERLERHEPVSPTLREWEIDYLMVDRRLPEAGLLARPEESLRESYSDRAVAVLRVERPLTGE